MKCSCPGSNTRSYAQVHGLLTALDAASFHAFPSKPRTPCASADATVVSFSAMGEGMTATARLLSWRRTERRLRHSLLPAAKTLTAHEASCLTSLPCQRAQSLEAHSSRDEHGWPGCARTWTRECTLVRACLCAQVGVHGCLRAKARMRLCVCAHAR
eukprot:6206900-Pleurochrysis_carterae.AAC.1